MGWAALGHAQSSAPNDNTAAEREAEALIASEIAALRSQLAPSAPRLSSNPELARIARARAASLAHGAPFSHRDWVGSVPAVDMVQARFGRYGIIGENIVMEMRGDRGFDANAFAKFATDQWMASQEHRDNILSPEFDASGIGVAVFGYSAYATQIFRGPAPPANRTRPPRPKGAGAVWAPGGY